MKPDETPPAPPPPAAKPKPAKPAAKPKAPKLTPAKFAKEIARLDAELAEIKALQWGKTPAGEVRARLADVEARKDALRAALARSRGV